MQQQSFEGLTPGVSVVVVDGKTAEVVDRACVVAFDSAADLPHIKVAGKVGEHEMVFLEAHGEHREGWRVLVQDPFTGTPAFSVRKEAHFYTLHPFSPLR